MTFRFQTLEKSLFLIQHLLGAGFTPAWAVLKDLDEQETRLPIALFEHQPLIGYTKKVEQDWKRPSSSNGADLHANQLRY